MLHGLERADGPAELLADLGVLDRHLQGGPAHADRFRRRQDAENRARTSRGTAQDPILGHCHVAQCHRPDRARGVKGFQCVHRDAFGVGVGDDNVVPRDEHQHIGVGCTEHRWALTGDDEVGADDDIARQAECADRRTVGQSGK